MKTGNTPVFGSAATTGRLASMEPGHEDREYGDTDGERAAVVEGLNGARS